MSDLLKEPQVDYFCLASPREPQSAASIEAVVECKSFDRRQTGTHAMPASPQTVHDLRRQWKPHKERLATVRSEHPTAIRFHRACSWMSEVEQLDPIRHADQILILQGNSSSAPVQRSLRCLEISSISAKVELRCSRQ